MEDPNSPPGDFERVEKAIRFIEENFARRPTLDEIAGSVHLSRFHFDRLFKRWAGISPVRFQQFLTLDYTKKRLAQSRSLLDAALDAGLSGPGRLHDLFVTFEAMTPGDFKRRGKGIRIAYGFGGSPFGECLVAITDRGICHLAFLAEAGRSEALETLRETWPGACLAESRENLQPLLDRIFDMDAGHGSRPLPFHLVLKGTNFQIKVWEALLRIPEGWMVSYRDLAALAGSPRACRAAAGAVAVNPVAYLIPCHRVIAGTGRIHRYRWGSSRKKAMLGLEAARTVAME